MKIIADERSPSPAFLRAFVASLLLPTAQKKKRASNEVKDTLTTASRSGASEPTRQKFRSRPRGPVRLGWPAASAPRQRLLLDARAMPTLASGAKSACDSCAQLARAKRFSVRQKSRERRSRARQPRQQGNDFATAFFSTCLNPRQSLPVTRLAAWSSPQFRPNLRLPLCGGRHKVIPTKPLRRSGKSPNPLLLLTVKKKRAILPSFPSQPLAA